jgi:predicted alpha/beta-fold hydrolase
MYFRRLIFEIFGFLGLFYLVASLFNLHNEYVTIGAIGILILLGIFLYLVATYHFKVVTGDWIDTLDYSQVELEEVEIPMKDNWNMIGVLLKAKNTPNTQAAPGIIIHHGVSGKKEQFGVFGIPLALHGYIVLMMDARAHGESLKRNRNTRKDDWYINEEKGIFPDFTRIVDYFIQRPEVDPNRVGCIGHSMGGTVCLSKGLLDPRIKLCIGIAPLYNFENVISSQEASSFFSEQWWSIQFLKLIVHFDKLLKVQEYFSPQSALTKISIQEAQKKVRLIHCEDDHLVVYEYHGKKILEALKLPERSCMITKKGDHPYRGQETLIIERIITWTEEIFGGISND